MPANQLRISGLLFAIIGFGIVWYFKKWEWWRYIKELLISV
jgi:hypothetical protein